eukprot:scaffold27191_cov28-Tisochrysis_lutea.AAC.1
MLGWKGVVLHASNTDMPPDRMEKLAVEVLTHEGLKQRAETLHRGQASRWFESFVHDCAPKVSVQQPF